MTDVAISSGDMQLVLRPAWGGRVVALTHKRFGEILVPLRDSQFKPDDWPRAGAYPLVPFHNRVRNAYFSFGQREARLRPHKDAIPNALHGMGSRVEWSLVSRCEDRAEIAWTWEASEEWPWEFSASQTFVVQNDALVLTMSIRNLDMVPMPAGLGWHPYFPSEARCWTDARLNWPIGPDYLPKGRSEIVGKIRETAYLSDWTAATIEMARCCVGLRAAAMDHLVIHAPQGGSVLCVEPASHLAAALNETWRQPGPDQGGMHSLAPGEQMASRIELSVSGKE